MAARKNDGKPGLGGAPPAAPPGPVPAAPERPTSETERIAGTPDERATTDWQHGEGEPRPETAPGALKEQGTA